MNKLRTLLKYFRPYRRGFIAGLALVVVSNLFKIAGPYLLKMAVDALEQNLTMDVVVQYAAAIVGVAVLGGVARYGMRELLNGISRKIERDLRNDLFEHMSRLSPEFYDDWRTGDLISRLTNDVFAVRQVAGPAIMYLVMHKYEGRDPDYIKFARWGDNHKKFLIDQEWQYASHFDPDKS